jgi:hypothetical protein
MTVAALAWLHSGEAAPSTSPEPAPRSGSIPEGLVCPDFEGDDIIWYDSSDLPELSDADCGILQGEKLEDGTCRMSEVSPVRSAFDPRTRRLDELAFSPGTCRSLIRTGFLESETKPPVREGDESESGEFPAGTAREKSPGGRLAFLRS